MTGFISRAFTSLALSAVLFAASAPVQAQESFTATHFARIDAMQEPGNINDIVANGIAIFKVLPGTTNLEYRVTVAGIDSITVAHIHRGERGENGPPVLTLDITDQKRTASGTFTGLSQSFIDSVMSGMTYVNIHTTAHMAGHIRGQIEPIPNATAPSMTTNQEPHPVASDSGSGSTLLFIDKATGVATYSVEWSGLTGRATLAHFHMSAPGQPSGPPVHTIAIPSDSTIKKSTGVWTIEPAHMAAMLEGRIYVNVHTAINPAGEIRATVMPLDFYSAAVSAKNEVPDRSASSNALGTAIALVLRMPGVGLAVISSIVNNTTGPIQMAHVHRGPIGENGAPFVNLSQSATPSNWDALGSPVQIADVILMANGGTYVNYHTTMFDGGEARGQLIGSLMNLPAPTLPASVPLAQQPARVMSAWQDRAGGDLGFHIPTGVDGIGSTTTLELYNAVGVRVARAHAQSSSVHIGTADIAVGAYLARLVVDGRTVATARVAVR